MVGFVRAHFAALCCPCLLYDASQCLLNGLTNEDQVFGVIWTQLLNQKFLNNGLEAKGPERLGNHPLTVRTTSSMLRQLTHIMSKIKLRLRKLSGCYASEHPHLRPKGPPLTMTLQIRIFAVCFSCSPTKQTIKDVQFVEKSVVMNKRNNYFDMGSGEVFSKWREKTSSSLHFSLFPSPGLFNTGMLTGLSRGVVSQRPCQSYDVF